MTFNLIQREVTNTISYQKRYRPPTKHHCKNCGKPLTAKYRNPNPEKRTNLCHSCWGKQLARIKELSK